MNKAGQPKRRFCPRGHDTFICGRYKSYGCKECAKEHRLESIDHRRNLVYKNKFGITLEQYNQMFIVQNGLCLGCYKHQKDDKRAFAVDHNHMTGRVRGLLCGNCNVALGNAQDSPTILRRLADYIEARGVLPSLFH